MRELDILYRSKKGERRMETTQQDRETTKKKKKCLYRETNKEVANTHHTVTRTLRLRTWFHQVLQNVRIAHNTDNRVLLKNLGI